MQNCEVLCLASIDDTDIYSQEKYADENVTIKNHTKFNVCKPMLPFLRRKSFTTTVR